MDSYSLVTEPSDEREGILTDRLVAYNMAHSPRWEANHDGRFSNSTLQVFVQDSENRLIGGLIGRTHGIRDWMEIGILWVDEARRGEGVGQSLLSHAEREARRRGCRYARLSTSDHQAPGFYERMGYVCYGRLEDCPPGETALYYRKTL